MPRKTIYLSVLTILLLAIFGFSTVFAATSITAVNQRPWIINDGGNLKSETELVINNTSSTFSAWVKITVTGKTAYMESLGSLATGNNSKVVHVLELNNDGDNVTFQIYNNSGGTGTALATDTRSQKKIRHWKVYVAHDMHMDIGYTDYQEYLKDTKWPGFLDNAFTYINNTNSWSADDQFRYPAEGSYLLYDSVWNVRNADWIQTLKSHVANGRISYPAGYMHICMEGLGTEEIARINYFSERYLRDRLGTGSNKVIYKTDDPGLSWANIDALIDSGIKYGMFRFNPDSSAWDINVYPKLFYLQGRIPGNKILTYDGPHYGVDEFDFKNSNSDVTFNNCTSKILNYHTSAYPYDAIITDFTTPYDNEGITANVMNNIKNLNAKTDSGGRDYVYPRFINSTVGDFFSYVEANFSASVPAYKGTVENWWNYGAASTAYETGINKVNHDKLPAAEFFATMANLAVSNTKYPCEDLNNAYNNMVIYDEHTWGPASSACDDQWRWKRNTAISGDVLADKVLNSSLTAINTLIPTTDRTIVVYNNLSWTRSDVVKVKQSDLPAHFDLTDIEAGAAVKYQKLADGNMVFVAPNVPGLGYKCFRVTSRADDPVFTTSVTTTANTIENNYFKVTFDSAGSISSILDKQNSNNEMVDGAAPYKMNQFIYYTTDQRSHTVRTTNPIIAATVSGSAGAIQGSIVADSVNIGAKSVRRNVILYDSIPRIDFVNEVDKSEAPSYTSQDEEGFFAFPLNVSNFLLKHEMPTGDVRPYLDSNINNPNNEQLYSSSTDHYTVNRWIDASNQSSYGITFSPINAPLVQYGERRSYLFSRSYNTAKPWIYSYVFNNKWWTNFQKTQPGLVVFKYALKSHTGADWKAGRADKFGMEAGNELKASVITGAQSGSTFNGTKGQFIGINQDNVVLTTAKLAEANGEGIILRFNETKGQDTNVTVDLGWLVPTSVTETDLVENDRSAMTLTNNTISFTIKGHGWKTVRAKKGTAPAQVTGLNAVMNANGARITWNSLSDSSLAYYEVFRDISSGFTPGTGNFLAAVTVNHYYDPQVKTGLSNTYYYKVRAVRAGLKGTPSSVAQATSGTITDTSAPTAPTNLKGRAMGTNRVTLSWEPSLDNLYVKGYKIYRDSSEIKDVDVSLNSHLDTDLVTNGTYNYTVKAYDAAGNYSAASNQVTVQAGPTPIPGNVAPLATITASSQFSSSYASTKTVDNIIGVHDSGEWASNGEMNPWIQLNWSSSKNINKVVLYDRVNLTDAANGGTLSFSDSSAINVTGILNDGSAKEITFANKSVTWLRFQVSGGSGMNVGLSEIQVFESAGPTATPTPTPTAAPTPGGYIQVDLSSSYNQDGFSFDTNRTDGAYDQGAPTTSTYSADLLNSNPTYDGAPYTLGPKTNGANNEIKGTGQTISLPQGQYLSIRLLGSATNGDQTGAFRINYTDSTFTDISVTEKDWCASNTSGEMVVQTMDHRHQGSADQIINTYVFAYYMTPAAGKTVASLALPNNANIHVLAITLASSSGTTPTPTPTPGATATPTPAGLVGWWKFDELSGTSTADSSGTGNTGTLSGGAAWSTGRVGGALSFDGTDDKVTVNDNATLDLTAFSITMWIYMDNLPGTGNYYALAVKGDDAFENYELLIGHPNSGSIHFPVKWSDGTRNEDFTTTQLTAGSWKHLVLTYDGASAKVYIDSVLDTTKTYNKTPAVNNNALIIGNEGTLSRFFKGKMDELRIYNRALTQQEITGIYNYDGN